MRHVMDPARGTRQTAADGQGAVGGLRPIFRASGVSGIMFQSVGIPRCDAHKSGASYSVPSAQLLLGLEARQNRGVLLSKRGGSPGVPSVQLLVPFLASELHLAGVDDDHDVPLVFVGRIRGLILALRKGRRERGYTYHLEVNPDQSTCQPLNG